ncbi:MAG TPA: stage II sporulation protein R [Candidatus Faecousia intestinigallinarum]|nr:stage II sporulation protein R [Candidatus Faecousia intestinigallinarum]
MRKAWKLFLLAAVVWIGIYIWDLCGQKDLLRESLIRLHVVANSDSAEDQAVKLQVRDAITEYLTPLLENIPTRDEAQAFLQAHIQDLQQIANDALRLAGSMDEAVVTLGLEEFPKRVYDTFALPAGIYESLRIRIGEAQGKNWWCVVFPQFCLPATAEGFDAVAVGSGLPENLAEALQGENEVRFFFLDCLGKLENFFGLGK